MNQFFKFFVFSNLYISLGSTLFYLYYAQKLTRDFSTSTPFLIFCGTFVSYHCLRLIPFLKGHIIEKEYKEFYQRKLSTSIYSILIAIFGVLYGLTQIELSQFLILLLAATIVLFYEKIIFNKFELRKINYLKPFIIAFVWALICVGMHYESMNQIFLYYFSEAFIFIFILCIAFDIKDEKFDKSQGVKNISHLIKDEKLKAFILLVFFITYLKIFEISLQIQIISALLLLFGVFQAKRKSNSHLFYLAIDGIIIIKSLAIFNLGQN